MYFAAKPPRQNKKRGAFCFARPPAVSAGVRNTVKGQVSVNDTYPFFVIAAASLALPLGELSPQVTERGIRSFLNHKVYLFANTLEFASYISIGEPEYL